MGEPFYGNGAGVQIPIEFSTCLTCQTREENGYSPRHPMSFGPGEESRANYPGYPRCAPRHGITPYGLALAVFRALE